MKGPESSSKVEGSIKSIVCTDCDSSTNDQRDCLGACTHFGSHNHNSLDPPSPWQIEENKKAGGGKGQRGRREGKESSNKQVEIRENIHSE